MYILGQMLTPDSKTRVLGKVVAYGDEWFGNESARKREDETTALPTIRRSQLQNQTGTTTQEGKVGSKSFYQLYS